MGLRTGGPREVPTACGARGVRVVTEWVDVTKATWPEARFDVVVCTYLHLPAPQRQAVLSHMASAVKPGATW